MTPENNLSFGKRFGFEPVDIPFQLDNIDKILRTELWNSYYIFYQVPFEYSYGGDSDSYRSINLTLWVNFFKNAHDDFPARDFPYTNYIRKHFEKGTWYKVYEFIELLFEKIGKNYKYKPKEFENYINEKLRSNNSGYTLSNGKFIPNTNAREIEEINKTQELSREHNLVGINEHLSSAIALLSQKPNPDYRNSIKESISMVEAISRIIEPTENTLGKALNKLNGNKKINKTLKIGFEKLYAYTNDKNGIRHALMDDENIDLEDANLFLVTCSAFTNYLIEKARKENLFKREEKSNR